jgi:uncharacterized protein with NRDE domain
VCLILFAIEVRPDFPLVLIANRDEFRSRAAAPVSDWPRDPRAPEDRIVAGKDLEAGGTWLGVTERGRLAALTNVRRVPFVKGPRSRGDLVVEALDGRASIESLMQTAYDHRAEYAPFNLLAIDLKRAGGDAWVSDELGVHRVARGAHGLSNATIDVPWPKVTRGVRALSEALTKPELDREQLFTILQDRTVAPDDALPKTGVPLDVERALSPGFLGAVPELKAYGTRCSTVVIVNSEGRVEIEERSFGDDGQSAGVVKRAFVLGGAATIQSPIPS